MLYIIIIIDTRLEPSLGIYLLLVSIFNCPHSLQGTQTGLYVASLDGNLKMVQYFLDHGADVNQPCDVSNCSYVL